MPPKAAKKPNIIVIMADDLGYSDLGCYGGDVETPNLDKLASNGVRFRNFYNCSRCCPTRASLLTGQYQHKVGLTRNGASMTRNGVTIAEVLKESGYQTCMVGKWHLSEAVPLTEEKAHMAWINHQAEPDRPFADLQTYPVNRGFQKHYGIIWGVTDYFDPFSLVDGLTPVKEVPKDYYITDAFSSKAVEYIQGYSKSDKPFFMYLAYTAPHWPLHALPEDIAKYKTKYLNGWNELQKSRYERQVKMGLVDPKKYILSPLEGLKWETLSAQEKEMNAMKLAVHAAMIDRMDQGIGQVIKTLEQTKQLDNTIIFFMSDNGASYEIPGKPGYDRQSATRDGRPLLYKNAPTETIGSEVSYTGIGSAWANAVNTPYRFWKFESFGGGIRTPMIVSWKGLKLKSGSFNDELAHVMDIMPTCLELSGTKYPTVYQGNKITSMDGKTLLPTLQGKKREGHKTLYFEHEGRRAVIEGDWKLVGPNQKPWELYNIKEDCAESKNLASQYPDKVKALQQKYEAWAKTMKL